ncbi:cell wall hydrolase [Pseudalkalibacillus caeni]|uniref:Spore cortex-lytic enzyme n=1 Tax=Exobacillus caeni TaxID=2574798 RepID=A0A5R9F7D4_9BACL|nr:cell wall hydrolase [Pseudalkalibacillus caeni]TLS37538.1 spore cortex-lytic enzyme [Pseudalkalibacillus caeni]
MKKALSKALLLFLSFIVMVSVFIYKNHNLAEANGPVVKVNKVDAEIKETQKIVNQLDFKEENDLNDYDTKEEVAIAQIIEPKKVELSAYQSWQQIIGTTYSVKEIEMLAKLVHGEARGESFEGKAAVAAVTLNRIQSQSFPDNLKDVIYQPRAYTAVADGQFNKKPTGEAYKAVYLALKGWDPTDGALFYYNPKTATSEWIRTRPTIKKIDKHVFAR